MKVHKANGTIPAVSRAIKKDLCKKVELVVTPIVAPDSAGIDPADHIILVQADSFEWQYFRTTTRNVHIHFLVVGH